VVRSRWLAAALAVYSFAGAAALLAWAWWGAGAQWLWMATAGVLWLLCSLSAAWFWRSAPRGTLVWSGTDWVLESSESSESAESSLPQRLHAPCTCLQVPLDLQHLLWLHLRPASGPPLWLWLERRSQPLLWNDLRRAVYSRAGSGSPDAGSFAPHSDPQA
jgi:hypothetical protein